MLDTDTQKPLTALEKRVLEQVTEWSYPAEDDAEHDGTAQQIFMSATKSAVLPRRLQIVLDYMQNLVELDVTGISARLDFERHEALQIFLKL